MLRRVRDTEVDDAIRSGTGRSAAVHDIPVVQNLQGVGNNLQDHLLLGVGFESLIPLDPPGPLAEAGLFTWIQTGPDRTSPNLQYFFGLAQAIAPNYMTSGPGFTFAPILSQPRSRGTVALVSRDPTALARVDPQYLNRDEDLAVLEYGIRYARELAHTSAFNKLRGRELAPGEAVTSTSELATIFAGLPGRYTIQLVLAGWAWTGRQWSMSS